MPPSFFLAGVQVLAITYLVEVRRISNSEARQVEQNVSGEKDGCC
jgi:hypothetical protein